MGFSFLETMAKNNLLKVTKEVSLMSRWMAIDLYIREIDSLRFELSMNRCSDRLSRLADEILEKEISAQEDIESWGTNVGRSQPKFPNQQGLSLPTQLPPRADLPLCAECGESQYPKLEVPVTDYIPLSRQDRMFKAFQVMDMAQICK